MTFPWTKLAGVTAALATLATAICAVVAPASAPLVAGLVTAGFPVLVGALWTLGSAYVAAVGAEKTRLDEAMRAVAEQARSAAESADLSSEYAEQARHAAEEARDV